VSIADAVVARLTTWAAARPGLISVYDTTIPGQPPADPSGLGMYVVVYERTTLRSTAVDSLHRDASGEVTVISAAWNVNASSSAAQPCRWLVTQVQSQLVDWVPTVTGLRCGPLVQVGNPQPMPEETLTDRHLIYASDQFHYEADKTS